MTNNFAFAHDKKDQFFLFGCYKTFKSGTTGNLFIKPVVAEVKKVVGYIKARIAPQDELVLEWKEYEAGVSKLPYLEGFSVNVHEDQLYIFGGKTDQGKMKNSLIRFRFVSGEHLHLGLKRKDNSSEVPWPRVNHSSAMSNEGDLFIFGGEISESDVVNDLWKLKTSTAEKSVECIEISKDIMTRRPKVGTPALWMNSSIYFIAKSSHETIAPIRNYLCCDRFSHHDSNTTSMSSSKKYLPFDSVPHTMTVFGNHLILGFESSIYTIPFTEGEVLKPTALPKSNLFDSNDVSLVKKDIKRSFKEQIRQLFEERPFPDVVFKVQGQNISAHRSFIATRSPFFLQLLSGIGASVEKDDEETKINEDSDDSIEISDLSPAAFTVLLEWLYCNEVLNLKDEVAAELFKVADKYGVSKLKDAAERCLVKNLTVEKLLERAKLACEENSKELENAVVGFAVREIEAVNKRYDLRDFPRSILFKICKGGN